MVHVTASRLLLSGPGAAVDAALSCR